MGLIINVFAVLVIVIPSAKSRSDLCPSESFDRCFDSDGKKPTSGIEVQAMSVSRVDCVSVCYTARYPRTVFYNDETKDCYCTKDAVGLLALSGDTGGMCMEIKGSTETWITSVLNVSSQYNYPAATGYRATQIIGPPDVYPNMGDSPMAWCPGAIDDNQWIEVAILEALYIYHVYIYETHHAGAVKTLSVRDTANNWHVLWSSPQVQNLPGRIFDPGFQVPTFKVDGFRLDIVMSVSASWVEFDAIKVVGRK